MAQLSPQALTGAGLQPNEAAASAGGDTVPYDESYVLVVRHTNSGGVATTVTLASQVGASAPVGLAASDVAGNIAAGGVLAFDLARAQNLKDASDLVHVSYGDATDLVVSLLKKQQ